MKKFFVLLAAAAVLFVGCKDEDDPMISIVPQELSFEGEASTQTIALTANYAWTATNTNDWITVSPMSGTGNETVKVTVTKNEGMDRSGNVTFTAAGLIQTLSISQSGFPTISVTPASLEFTSEGGSQTITVSSNKNWSVSGAPDWITVAPASGNGSASGQSLTVTAEANDGVDRSGSFTVSIDGTSVTVDLKQAGSAIEYGGVVYKTVVMKDGRTWMASPLKYIPEGKTPSDNPKDGSGLWYPYSSDGNTCTPITEDYDGLLYDYPTAFGADITADNFKDFEGTQGICPDGWHIPTRAEFVSLVGRSNKGADDAAEIIESSAPYYDKDNDGGKITTLDADGFGWSFLGTVIVGSPAAIASGSYNKLITDDTTCSVDAYKGRNRLTYIMSSTGNAAAANGNIQFFGLMSTFTSKYPEGRLHASFSNFRSGYEVRCIKD